MYSEANARATAAAISKSFASFVPEHSFSLQLAEVVKVGDVYSMSRCCLYVRWKPFYDDLWYHSHSPATLLQHFFQMQMFSCIGRQVLPRAETMFQVRADAR